MSEKSIKSIEKALKILMFFKSQNELGISEMSKLIDLPKSTVHGIVKTLCKYSFLTKNKETEKYCLGEETFRIGIAYISATDILTRAKGIAEDLSNKLGEVVDISVLMNQMCIDVAQYIPSDCFVLIPQIGSSIPAYCTSAGKVLLMQYNDNQIRNLFKDAKFKAYTKYSITSVEQLIEEVRVAKKGGYAISNQEILIGLTSMAAPIYDSSGRICAAISVSGSTLSIMEDERYEIVINAILQSAKEISNSIGY